jgi:hypothetical protein
MKETIKTMSKQMTSLMQENSRSTASEIRLLKIVEAQRSFIDGGISREDMESKIEEANKVYCAMLSSDVRKLTEELNQKEIEWKIKTNFWGENL